MLWIKPTSIVKFEIKDYRRRGHPKLAKPKELKGIKQAMSIDYHHKCRCQVFIKGDDVWVKHRDYFSPSLVKSEYYGTTLNQLCEIYLGKERPNKFVYEDAWGDVLARAEAWIRLKNLIADIENEVFPLDISHQVLRQQEKAHGLKEYELEYTHSGNYMVRFWKRLVLEVGRFESL